MSEDIQNTIKDLRGIAELMDAGLYDEAADKVDSLMNALETYDEPKYELSCGGDPVPAYKPRTKRNDQLNKEHKL